MRLAATIAAALGTEVSGGAGDPEAEGVAERGESAAAGDREAAEGVAEAAAEERGEEAAAGDGEAAGGAGEATAEEREEEACAKKQSVYGRSEDAGRGSLTGDEEPALLTKAEG